ncbi:uncharacterized protein LOC121359596 isoform X2 [Pyrgilauda ruficollis]|uniref:uncharacterized protein LOC121359596 isoform X2 n=1 Tax=Pyrgilauda ruficollis TaxID=221976 RepID=UPI001B86AB57|nr:uncharacterized protein LOC121359596 isoform X2 [Pyrgilauda ruficollis]
MGPPHLTPGLVRPLSPADPTLGAFSHVQPCTSGLLLGRAKDLAAASFLCLSRQSVPAPGQKMRGTEVTLDSVESLHFWYGALRISCQKPAGSVSAAAASLPPLFLPCRLSALSGVNSPRPYRKCPGHEPRSECHLFSPRHGVQLLPKDPRGGSIKVPVIVRKWHLAGLLAAGPACADAYRGLSDCVLKLGDSMATYEEEEGIELQGLRRVCRSLYPWSLAAAAAPSTGPISPCMPAARRSRAGGTRPALHPRKISPGPQVSGSALPRCPALPGAACTGHHVQPKKSFLPPCLNPSSFRLGFVPALVCPSL